MRLDHSKTLLLLFLVVLSAVSVGLAHTSVNQSAGLNERCTYTGSDTFIGEVYPDSYLENDKGEYILLYFGEPTDTSSWTLDDGEGKHVLPNTTLSGCVYLGSNDTLRESDIKPDYPLELELANTGESLLLKDENGKDVDRIGYGDEGQLEPREGDILTRVGSEWEIRRLGASNFRYSVFETSSITAFTAPDSAGKTIDGAFDSAEDTILIEAFEFDSIYIADSLIDAENRGVEVKILIEGSPPGGFESDDASVLEKLVNSGVEVYVADGEWKRYRFFHAKFAVIDSRKAVVTSENWKRDSMSPEGDGARGWGVVVESQEGADTLTEVFYSDLNWTTVKEWDEADVNTVDPGPEDEDEKGVKTDFKSRSFSNPASVGLVLAPDTSLEPVIDLIEKADRTLYVEQAYIRDWDSGPNPYLQAVLERARAGVKVRVLLDGRWYTREGNTEIVERLNTIAQDENLDLEARISEVPIHNKGVIVDGESVLISSINWNENSVTNNREMGLIIHDTEVASYFTEVFSSDWENKNKNNGGFQILDYLLEIAIIIIVTLIGVWLVFRVVD